MHHELAYPLHPAFPFYPTPRTCYKHPGRKKKNAVSLTCWAVNNATEDLNPLFRISMDYLPDCERLVYAVYFLSGTLTHAMYTSMLLHGVAIGWIGVNEAQKHLTNVLPLVLLDYGGL